MMILAIGIGRKGVAARKLWPQIHRIQCCVSRGIRAAETKGQGGAVTRKWGALGGWVVPALLTVHLFLSVTETVEAGRLFLGRRQVVVHPRWKLVYMNLLRRLAEPVLWDKQATHPFLPHKWSSLDL